MKPGWENAKEL